MMKNKYTFDTFVENATNYFAFVVCKRIAKECKVRHNPLLLCGPTGCGKTHLLNAVCSSVAENDKTAIVKYIDFEQMACMLIEDIKGNGSALLEVEKADLLVIDNAEFLSGKENLEVKLTAFILKMYARGKHIIIAFNRRCRELDRLESIIFRVAEEPILIEIDPPDTELKLEFVDRFLSEYPFDITEEATHYLIAIKNTIPRIKGGLQAACFWSKKFNSQIDIKWMKEHINLF